MNHLGLFEGIGGFSLAARWMGWKTVAWCEWNPFGQRVLRHHFPEAEGHGDITKTDFTKYANTIDILTGGFPCQPYSSAGKRLGKEDDRHLWPEMLRVIREVQPTWVVGENVFGIVSWSGGLVFDEVQADLEAEGYEVQPYVLPAVSVNAPHRRDRVWFVAYRNNNGLNKCNSQHEKHTSEGRLNALCDTCQSNDNGHASDTSTKGLEHSREARKLGDKKTISRRKRSESTTASEHTCRDGYASDTDLSRCEQSKQKNEGKSPEQFDSNSIQSSTTNSNKYVDNTKCIGWNEKRNDNGFIKETQQGECRQEQFSGADSAQGWWRNFPSVSPICFGDDGLSDRLDSITFSKWRNESIKAGGNAIVPQVAYQIFKSIEEYEKRF